MNNNLLEQLDPKRGKKYQILFTKRGTQIRYKAEMFYNGRTANVLNFNNFDYDEPNIDIPLQRLLFLKLIEDETS